MSEHRYLKNIKAYLLTVLLSCISYTSLWAQPPAKMLALEKKVYQLNNDSKYDSSIDLLQRYMDKPDATEWDKYYANLFLSYTYKRLFNYEKAIEYLNAAMKWGSETDNEELALNNIECQLAYAYFDIQKYDSASILMEKLSNAKYKYISAEDEAKIIMQMGYLDYLKKNYANAINHYNLALDKMGKTSPCDLPIIYGKMIMLYAEMKDTAKMLQSYRISMKVADSCKILKYSLYNLESLRNAWNYLKNYKEAYRAFELFDSISVIYNKGIQSRKIEELEGKFKLAENQKELMIKEKDIHSRNLFIWLLWLALLALLLSFVIYRQRSKRLQLITEKEVSSKYTQQLLDKTETDRKKLALQLHDTVNHELLILKNSIPPEAHNAKLHVDTIINLIRDTSRNLHPVVLSSAGLKASIEQLCHRMQSRHSFMITTHIDYNKTLDAQKELHVYRIIQEALTNMIKYSEGLAGMVRIESGTTHTVIEVVDNGKGFNVDDKLKSGTAFGLQNIVERSKFIDANFQIKSGDEGTRITVNIPNS